MSVIDNSLVKFYYSKTANITEPLDVNGIYFVEPTRQILVGSHIFGGGSNVIQKTTAEWDSTPDLIAQDGVIYVYTEHHVLENKPIPGVKIGDGVTKLIDLPFIEEWYQHHVDDRIIHVTQADRDRWDNHLQVYVDPIEQDTLVFAYVNDGDSDMEG